MYSLDISPELDKILSKLIKKNKKQYEIIMKKTGEIVENPQHYKNLRKPLQHLKRVHIDGNLFLIIETALLDKKFDTIGQCSQLIE